jgi:hypothetical protein
MSFAAHSRDSQLNRLSPGMAVSVVPRRRKLTML